jgi:serine/threonine-protein kinase
MLKVGSVIDEFELKELLGQGGMGAVFAAWDDNLKRPVAVKVIALPSDTAKQREFRQRFKREAEALGAVSEHPHVVRVYKSGLDDEGNPYLVMERLRGETLQVRIERASGGRLSPEETVALIVPILGALAHVHDRGVIHRDVKPSNILLARDATGQEVPKLIDFGVAKDVTVSLPAHLATATGQNPGTLLYMSPEQACGARDLDARSDLYAMGVVLYVALSGTFPYDLDAGGAWLTALKEAKGVRPLDELVAGLPPELVRVVHRALAADRDARFESAGEFCDALEGSLRPLPPQREPGMPDHALLPRDLGPYRLIREVGRGGMGCVYEARHTALDKRVAIKTMLAPPGSDSSLHERFRREGIAAARVKHPNIVDVTDSGVSGDTVYLAMEFLEGEDLRAHLRERKRLSLQEMASILVPVCDAVATAHRAGVVHRDLKPSNILLARDMQGITPKVVDFGVSKLLGATQAITETGNIVGTLGYMAPEVLVLGASAATPASDQFALGVIACECLTGRRPAELVAPEAGSPLGDLDRTLPAGVSAALRRAIERDPARRLASVWNLAKELLPHASPEVQARHAMIAAGLDATGPGPRRTSGRGRLFAFVALVSLVGAIALVRGWVSRSRPTPAPLRTAQAALTVSQAPVTTNSPIAPDAAIVVAPQSTAPPSPHLGQPSRTVRRASQPRPVVRHPSEIPSRAPTQDEQETRPRPDPNTYQHPDGG